jgi:hypothetical protein
VCGCKTSVDKGVYVTCSGRPCVSINRFKSDIGTTTNTHNTRTYVFMYMCVHACAYLDLGVCEECLHHGPHVGQPAHLLSVLSWSLLCQLVKETCTQCTHETPSPLHPCRFRMAATSTIVKKSFFLLFCFGHVASHQDDAVEGGAPGQRALLDLCDVVSVLSGGWLLLLVAGGGGGGV